MEHTPRKRRRQSILVIGTAAAAAAAVPGHAGLIEFTDRDAWLQGAGEVTRIGFTEYPHGTLLGDQYQDLGIHFTDVDDAVFHSGAFSDGAGADGGHIHDELRVSFAEPIQWLGADFVESVLEYEVYRDGELIDASGEFFLNESPFAGLFSEVPFDAAIIRDPGGGTTVDDLYFQQIVPAPGGLAVWIVGLAGGIRTGRRRRARAR